MMLSPYLSIQEMVSRIRSKELSPSDLLDSVYRRYSQYDSSIGALLECFDRDSVLVQSASSGPLYGIPGVLKDNICIAGRTMSCGSRMLQGYRAPYDSTVAARLKAAGALLIGRSNMDEFAMGSSTETSAFQKTRNPWNLERVAGGSSGGSIAAVAAGYVPWALGSETGGSVRQPAALCGIVAMKPTYGLVSRYGLTAYASSTDQVAPATRTVYDNALMLSVIAGQESPIKDSTARPLPEGYDLTRNLTGVLPKGIRIGFIPSMFDMPGFDPHVSDLLRQALQVYRELGATLVEVTLPSMALSAATYFVVSRAEASSNLARFDGVRYGHRTDKTDSLAELYAYSRSEGFGAEVLRRIVIGTYVLSKGNAGAYYQWACQAREEMRRDASRVYGQVDCVFMPVSPIEAFPFGALDPMALDLQDYFTSYANLVGCPALAIPCGFLPSGLAAGFQLMGPDWGEELLYRVGYAYEQHTPWHTIHPDLSLVCA